MDWGTDNRNENIVDERHQNYQASVVGEEEGRVCVHEHPHIWNLGVGTPTSWAHVAIGAVWTKSTSMKGKAKTSWNPLVESESGWLFVRFCHCHNMLLSIKSGVVLSFSSKETKSPPTFSIRHTVSQ